MDLDVAVTVAADALFVLITQRSNEKRRLGFYVEDVASPASLLGWLADKCSDGEFHTLAAVISKHGRVIPDAVQFMLMFDTLVGDKL